MGNIVGIAIVWLIIEMLVWYLIAQFVSGWWVFGWFILAGIIGMTLIKKGIATLKPMAGQAQMAMMNPAMRPNENKVVKAVGFSIAGILLVLPGILSDIVALLVLLPAVQTKFKNFATDYAKKNPEKIMQMVASKMGGIDPSQMGGMAGMGGLGGLGGMMGGMGNMGGNQNPFGTNNPFGNMGGQNPFGNANPNPMAKRKFGGTTVDGQAKTVNPNVKKIKSANDD
ncbi:MULTISPECIES: FxsA family protein [unclassified Moraxella]|uniref:FxsA family protein n=1 Tax=unclassified Moraxella TaxID=2685852 RepID=UPI003AF7E06B